MGHQGKKRLDPLALFFKVASSIVDVSRCHLSFQSDLEFPAIVYAEVGVDTIQTFQGPKEVSVSIRADVRAKVWEDVFRISDELISGLRKEKGRLIGIESLVDDPEDDLDIYRRIRTVRISR